MPSNFLHHEGRGGDAGQEMMMVEPVWKKPIGHPQEVDLARPEDVLGLHPLASLARDHARHHIGFSIDPREASVAASSQAIWAVWSMQLGAASKGNFVRRPE